MLSRHSGEVGGTVEELLCIVRYGRALSMILIDCDEVDEDSVPRFIYTKLTPRDKKSSYHEQSKLQSSVVH